MKKLFKGLLSLAFALLVAATAADSTLAASANIAKVTSLQAYNIDDDEINLKWKKLSNVTGYQVYAYTSNKWRHAGYTKKLNFEVDDLLGAKQYKFKVRGYRVSGNKKVYGPFSSVITATTDPYEVENLTVSGRTLTTVSLKWNKVARATGYQVYIYSATSGKFTKKTSVKNNSVTIKKLKANKNYKFKVRAYFKANSKVYFGEFSDVVSVKTKAVKQAVASSKNSLISKSEAISIALKRAGVAKNKAIDLSCELDKEKNVYVYEVDFEYGRYDYEYVINAKTGKVLRAQKEIDY